MTEKQEQPKKPVYKKWWFWAIIVLVLIGVYGAQDNTPKKVGDNNGSSTNTEQQQTSFKVGDIIAYKNKEITVKQVERNYNTGNQFSKPKEGKEFVRVHIFIENKSDDKMSYNVFNWEMQDSTGDIKSQTFAVNDSSLSSGELAKGGKKTGTIVFEVPKDDKNLTLHYKDSFFSSKTIEIKLQ